MPVSVRRVPSPVPLKSVVRPALGVAMAVALAGSALAQSAANLPVTGAQRATAQQAAQQGVPLSALAPNAPDQYTVQRGDTLWGIAGLFLRSPWRWPELWGMNLREIRNPHLIYPGQVLYLDKSNGRARLRTVRPLSGGALPTERLSPHIRESTLAADALPTLKPHLIEPFLAEPVVVDAQTLSQVARIVAVADERVLLTKGDRAYARSPSQPMPDANAPLAQRQFRVFREATPLKDPFTGEVLGYEAQYVGRAVLVRSESHAPVPGEKDQGATETDIVPATIDITGAKEEMRVGDRLLPEPVWSLQNYVPRAPDMPVNAAVVSTYGNAVRYAAQNQVIAINRGARDGLEVGHVLELLSGGGRMIDRTDAQRPTMRLPDERNGLAMVFRTWDRVSYALVLDIQQGVKVGDRLVNPR